MELKVLTKGNTKQKMKRRKLFSYDFKAQDKDNFFYKTYLTNTYSPLKYNINFNRNNHIFPGTSTSE